MSGHNIGSAALLARYTLEEEKRREGNRPRLAASVVAPKDPVIKRLLDELRALHKEVLKELSVAAKERRAGNATVELLLKRLNDALRSADTLEGVFKSTRRRPVA
jgi:hypothetical protein